MRRRRVSLGASVIVVAAWIAAFGAWGGGTVERADQPGSVPLFGASAVRAGTGARDGLLEAGPFEQGVGTGDGLTVRVDQVRAGGTRSTPGSYELTLDLRVRNDSDALLTLTPLDISLRDRRGIVWRGMRDRRATAGGFPATALAPGEEAGGLRVFVLPVGTEPGWLRVDPDGGGSGVEVGLPARDLPVDDPAGEPGPEFAQEGEIAGRDG